MPGGNMAETKDCTAEIADEIQADASGGIPAGESVIKLHGRGMSVIASVRIIRKAYSLGLGEAKELVANHYVWKSVTESAEPFHDALIADTERALFSDSCGERQSDFRDRYEILLMKKFELERKLESIRSELGSVKNEISLIEKHTAGC
jgi:hypothetical protein